MLRTPRAAPSAPATSGLTPTDTAEPPRSPSHGKLTQNKRSKTPIAAGQMRIAPSPPKSLPSTEIHPLHVVFDSEGFLQAPDPITNTSLLQSSSGFSPHAKKCQHHSDQEGETLFSSCFPQLFAFCSLSAAAAAGICLTDEEQALQVSSSLQEKQMGSRREQLPQDRLFNI